MKRSEIKEYDTERIIALIYYMGISMVNSSTKKQEKELSWLCDELAARGIVEDSEALYESMCK